MAGSLHHNPFNNDRYIITQCCLKANSNLLKCHINGDANIEMLYFKWSGVVKAGQTVNFGDFTANIPDGKSFLGLFLTPKCTIHISMSYYDNCIFAYSESFTGEIYYDVLMIVG